MSEAIRDTIQEWRETASYWAKHHGTIRQMFEPLTRALIEQARISEGARVVDVAGGAGEPSLTIAQEIGEKGQVICTDPVAEMLATAEKEALSHGIRNIQFQQCTADSLPFAHDMFDSAVSRLGIMFFPDPVAGVREMLRVIKPGGYVALAVWGKSEANPYSYVVTNVLSRHVQATAPVPDAADAFRFAEPGKLANVLNKGGAIDVAEVVVDFDLTAPLSAEEFWTFRSEISESLRSKLKTLDDKQKRQITREVLEAATPFFANGQMRFPAQMIIVSGRKPD